MSERSIGSGERASATEASPALDGSSAPLEAKANGARTNRRRLALHALFGALGLGALGFLVHQVGPRQLVETLRSLARWLPLLLVLEALRIACEAGLTAAISPEVRRRFGLLALLRIHLIGFAVSMVMPAGRAAAEAAKAAMLSRHIGTWRAAAIGTTSQSVVMLGGLAIALPSALAAYLRTGASPLTGTILSYAALTMVGFTLVQLAARQRRLGGFLGRRFAKAKKPAAAFQDAMAEIPVVPLRAAAFALANRILQVLQFGLLLHAVGAAPSVGRALIAQGVNLVGGSAGDFIPGQLGATDGAFALAAPILGLEAGSAVAITVMIHVVQLSWAAIGASAPLWWRERERQEHEPDVREQTGRGVRTV